jgi:hypothetical protein
MIPPVNAGVLTSPQGFPILAARRPMGRSNLVEHRVRRTVESPPLHCKTRLQAHDHRALLQLLDRRSQRLGDI